MDVCICVCIYIYIYTHVHVHVHMHIHIHIPYNSYVHNTCSIHMTCCSLREGSWPVATCQAPSRAPLF